MLCLNMNTGETSRAPREDVADSVVEDLRALTMQGGDVPGHEGFTVRVERLAGGGVVFTIACGHAAMATCGLAWNRGGARVVWARLEAIHGQTFRGALKAEPPGEQPWLAVLSHPPIVYGHSCREWIAGFQHAFAWSILDERMFA